MVCVGGGFFFFLFFVEREWLSSFFRRLLLGTKNTREIIEYFIEYLDKGRRGVLFFRDESNKSRLSL